MRMLGAIVAAFFAAVGVMIAATFVTCIALVTTRGGDAVVFVGESLGALLAIFVAFITASAVIRGGSKARNDTLRGMVDASNGENDGTQRQINPNQPPK